MNITANDIAIFRELLLSQVSSLQQRQDTEIARMKALVLEPRDADYLLVESVKQGVLPASNLPKVVEAWENPKYPPFEPRTAWSLYNAFSEVEKSRSPRLQMQNTLALSRLFREELATIN
jgi:hypothetical protein